MIRLRILLIIILAVFVPSGWSQTAIPISGIVISQAGGPVPGAQIRVCQVTSTGSPCTPTSPIFQDVGLTIPASNPTIADFQGNYVVYAAPIAAPGLYLVQVSPKFGTTYNYVVNGNNAVNPVVGCNFANVSGFGNFTCSGSVNAGVSISAPIINATSSLSVAGPISATGSLSVAIPGNFSPLAPSTCANTGFVNGASMAMWAADNPPTINGSCGGVILPSNQATPITGGFSTSSTITVAVASLPASFQVIGQPIQVSGATPFGFNTPLKPSSPATVLSFTATSVTFASTNNPGAWSSGGTLAIAGPNQSDGVAGMVDNYIDGSTAVGGIAAVGGLFQTRGFAPNSSLFGINIISLAEAGSNGSAVIGGEIDVDNLVPVESIEGLVINPSNWVVQPPISSGFVVEAPQGAANAQWSQSFWSQNGASAIAFEAGTANPNNTPNNSPSSSVLFESRNSAGTAQISTVQADANGDILLSPASSFVVAPLFKSTDTSTASLTMDSVGGANFLLSENSTGTTGEPFTIAGPSVTAIPSILLDATNTEIAGLLSNLNGTIIPATATGFHGTSGIQLQFSDGTGNPGDFAKFASDGSITDGGSSGAGVTSINATAGAFTFTFNTGAGSCTGTTCNFTGTGTGGAVSSVFARTGAIAAVSGDYAVGQITGAAPLASPALTGTPTAPTPSTGDNSTKIATTAFVQASVGTGVSDVTISPASFTIPANTCFGSSGSTTPATVTMTGLTTSMQVSAGFTGNPSSLAGWGSTGGLNIAVWPSATNTASYVICNSTAASITGSAITFVLAAK